VQRSTAPEPPNHGNSCIRVGCLGLSTFRDIKLCEICIVSFDQHLAHRNSACTAATGPDSFNLIQQSADIRVLGALASQCILGNGRKVRVVGRCDFDFHARDQIRSSSSVSERSAPWNMYTSCSRQDDREGALLTHAWCNRQVVKSALQGCPVERLNTNSRQTRLT
jgi:hypothetical protein